MFNIRKIDPETLEVSLQGTQVNITRMQAIKLRNRLNQFINNEMEDEEDEENNGVEKERMF